MGDVTLSAGVRQNLLALQTTASLLSTTQNDLATGKKVNSALDNPSNFFTSQSLSNRANDLSALLDSIGQAQQTLTTADQGITSLTNLVQSAKSIANQALQSPTGTVNYTAIAGNVPIGADTTRITSTATVASAVGGVTASVQSNVNLTATGLSNLNVGDTLTFRLGSGTTYTATFTTSGANSFTTAAGLRALLSSDFGSAATVSGSTGVTLTSNDVTNDFTIGSTNTGLTDARTSSPTDLTSTAHTLGDALTVTDTAGHSASFYYVAGNASAANGTFTTAADLQAALTDPASNVHNDITSTAAPGGDIQFNSNGALTVAGNIGAALGINGTTNANYNTTLAGLTGNITVQVGSNAVQTLTFGSGVGQIATKAALTAALNTFTDVTGGYDSAGDVQFTPSSSSPVTIGGTPATVTALGLALGVTTPVASVVTPNATRTSLQAQYNDLLTQIDQMASDASYNGINLLNGDNLKVVFNESSTSSLTIQGVKFNSTGLGLTAISGTGFQDNNNVDTTLTNIQTALTTLRTQAASFGSNETTVEARQDFTKNLINTLQTGADNLVLADTNQEGADLLALQTRQQLSITSLSLASQADQAILKVL
jgi:flagellin-like hook-associated protein FlgL